MTKKKNPNDLYKYRGIVRNYPRFISLDYILDSEKYELQRNKVYTFLEGREVDSLDDLVLDSNQNCSNGRIEEIVFDIFQENNYKPPFLFVVAGDVKEIHPNEDIRNFSNGLSNQPFTTYTQIDKDRWLWSNREDNRRVLLNIGQGELYGYDFQKNGEEYYYFILNYLSDLMVSSSIENPTGLRSVSYLE